MGLERYRLDINSQEFFLALFQQNRMIRQRYRIRTKSGELLEGIPTTDARVGDVEPNFHVRGDQNYHYVIPFADLKAAESIAVHDDRYFMSVAIGESRRCVSEQGAPRPLVGAVLVQEDSIVAKAFRGEITSGDHAEYELLETRLQGRVVAGSTLYTTLEPCTERGVTKEGKDKVPCVKRIIDRRIRRVVIGMLDPNQKIRGEGIWRLREAGVHVALCDPDQMAQIEEINRDCVRHYRKSGLAEGHKSGLAEGELKGKRDALVRLLTRAAIVLTDKDRARIHSCEDAEMLDKWIDNVVGAKTLADVLS